MHNTHSFARPAPFAHLSRPFVWVHACMLIVLFAGPSACLAQDIKLPKDPTTDPDRWLSEEKWSELRYGLSIREPKDATRVADTAQGDVMRWAQPDGTRIRLSFARGAYEALFEGPDGKVITKLMPAKIDLLKKQVGDELKMSVRGTVTNLRTDQVIMVNKLGGVINYFTVKPNGKDAEPYLYGVALLQLDKMSIAIIRLECPPHSIAEATSTFACMVDSIRTEPIQDVNKRINTWLTNAEEVLNKTTQEDRLKVMRNDRLYRVLEDAKDLGYIRVWQRYQDDAYYKQKAKDDLKAGGSGQLVGIDRFQTTGNAIVVQSHFQGQGASIDRLFEAVDSTDDINGYWQIKINMRFRNDPKNFRAGSWVETGVRGKAIIGGKSMDHLQVTREGTPPRHMVDYLLKREKDPSRRLRYPSADKRSYPSGDLSEVAWPTPKRAFLSFTDASLMPALLPREAKTYAFAAYHPETSRIDYRIMRVEPTNTGGKTVYIRPVLDHSEQVLVFDRNNELVRHTFPDGREMRQTTREELARIWAVRLRD